MVSGDIFYKNSNKMKQSLILLLLLLLFINNIYCTQQIPYDFEILHAKRSSPNQRYGTLYVGDETYNLRELLPEPIVVDIDGSAEVYFPRSSIWYDDVSGATVASDMYDRVLSLVSPSVIYSAGNTSYTLTPTEITENITYGHMLQESMELSPVTTGLTGPAVGWPYYSCKMDPENVHTAKIQVFVDSVVAGHYNYVTDDIIDYLYMIYGQTSNIFKQITGVRFVIAKITIGRVTGDYLWNNVPPNAALLQVMALLNYNKGFAVSQLITGRQNFTGTVGLAYVAAACKYGVSYSVYTPDITKLTLVSIHEMGHSFGALHDGDSQQSFCASTCVSCSDCDCVGKYIMNPYVIPTVEFSLCSQTSICNYLNSLLNDPTAGDCIASPTCGDGICQSWEIGCTKDCGYCGDGACTGNEDENTCGLDCGRPIQFSYVVLYGTNYTLRLPTSGPIIRLVLPDFSVLTSSTGTLMIPWKYSNSTVGVSFRLGEKTLSLSLIDSESTSVLVKLSSAYPVIYGYLPYVYKLSLTQVNRTGTELPLTSVPNSGIVISYNGGSYNNTNYFDSVIFSGSPYVNVSSWRNNDTYNFSENCTLTVTKDINVRWHTLAFITNYPPVRLSFGNTTFTTLRTDLAKTVYFHSCRSGLYVKGTNARNTSYTLFTLPNRGRQYCYL